MPLEIERKFLVKGAAWKELASAVVQIEQVYLVMDHNTSTSVRIRKIQTPLKATQFLMTIKNNTPNPLARNEIEFSITQEMYVEMFAMHIGNVIQKNRYYIVHGEHIIEVDEFQSTDLVLAEIEMNSINEKIPNPPDWIGTEVTEDHRYKNTSIAGL